ncbi:MAG: hypothetical protein PVH77_08820 [Phycisphaerales bacterium]
MSADSDGVQPNSVSSKDYVSGRRYKMSGNRYPMSDRRDTMRAHYYLSRPNRGLQNIDMGESGGTWDNSEGDKILPYCSAMSGNRCKMSNCYRESFFSTNTITY